MDPSRKRQIRGWHARHAFYCTCGKIAHGNGGRWSHRDMHARRGDGHHYITSTEYTRRGLRP